MRRRTFLLTGLGVGGTLILGWSVSPPRQRLHAGRPIPGADGIVLNGWLAIAPDDTVTVVVPRAEMGQGAHTAIAMLIAEELDCDWDRVRVVHAPIDRIYNNVAAIVDGLPIRPEHEAHPLARTVRWFAAKAAREVGLMMTSASSTVRDAWDIARDAGATARVQLLEAAAAQWLVPVTECTTERGVVRCGTREARYGALVSAASTHRPVRVTRKQPAAFTRIGQPTARLDTPAVVRGALTYGIDVRMPGLRYAAVAMPPALGARPLRYDASAARAQPGVQDVVVLAGSRYGNPPAVAVIATSWWYAQRALRALNVQWSESTQAATSTDGIRATLRSLAEAQEGFPFRRSGNADEQIASARRASTDADTTAPRPAVLDAIYDTPYLAHATMEPLNATVLVSSDRAEVWTGTQLPDVARRAAAHVLDLDEDQVTLHQHQLGGGFGRRLEADYVAMAAEIARAVPGTPVSTIWSRTDDLQHDMYRPACAARLTAALDANGKVAALTVHSASQAPFQAISRRIGFVYASHVPDRTTTEGAWDQPYEIPAVTVAHAQADFAVPVGLWRSVGHSHHAFFLESFIDELAARADRDPVAFRLDLLSQHPREAHVVRSVAEKAAWGTPLPPTADGQPQAMGMALHSSFGTVVAQVATVSLGPANDIRVHRVVSAIDCGLPVNPSGIQQQVEGAIVMGLSAALFGDVPIANGRVQATNYHDHRLVRQAECPSMATHIVGDGPTPYGVGEPGLPPIAPAVANALYALTGTRLRSLPLRWPPTS